MLQGETQTKIPTKFIKLNHRAPFKRELGHLRARDLVGRILVTLEARRGKPVPVLWEKGHKEGAVGMCQQLRIYLWLE